MLRVRNNLMTPCPEKGNYHWIFLYTKLMITQVRGHIPAYVLKNLLSGMGFHQIMGIDRSTLVA